MHNRPTLSICIPTYNREGLLDRCLCELQDLNNYDISYEIVISDNASTDGTSNVVSSHIESGILSNIRYIRQTETVEAVQNFINSYYESSGEFVTYLADDDSLNVENLIKIISGFSNNNELAAIYTDWEGYDAINKRVLYKGLNIDQPYLLSIENPWDSGIILAQVNPDIGIWRSKHLLTSIQTSSRGYIDFRGTAYNLLRHGKILISNICFYKENRTLPQPYKRDYWVNMDLRDDYINDFYRSSVENMFAKVLRDMGAEKANDQQSAAIKALIDTVILNRYEDHHINMLIINKRWKEALFLRRRYVLWRGVNSQERRRWDVTNISIPATIYDIVHIYDGLQRLSRLVLYGFTTDYILEQFKSQYPDSNIYIIENINDINENDMVIFKSIENKSIRISDEANDIYVVCFEEILINNLVGNSQIEIESL